MGSNAEISITGLAERVLKKTGSKSQIKYIPYDEAYPAGFEDMQRRIPDLTRIASLIGFRPTLSLDDILNDVIEELSRKRDEVQADVRKSA